MEKVIKIIIADDSSVFLEALNFLITRNMQFEIIDTCCNGLELINSPRLFNADLVITDIEMTEMNGIEAAKRISYLHPNLPIIALTMFIEKIYLRTIVEAGFKGFIYKPNVSNDLFDVIDKVLQKEYVFPDYLTLK
jgi:DNA-binding NarL/FixJ family response regulator